MIRQLAMTGRFFAEHPLTADAKLAAWRRWATWQARSRLKSEVIVDWIGGQRLAARRTMTGATGNIYVGLHEFAAMMLPLHVLRPGDTFIDGGANVGSYTVLASGIAGATTLAFEPDPVTVIHLRRNIALNGLEDRVTVIEAALGDREGNVAFSTGLDTVNHVIDEGQPGARIVRLTTLDACAGDNGPIMMKLDLEGYEDAALRGAGQLVAGESLKIIESESFSDETAAWLNAHGFARVYYRPAQRDLVDFDPGGQWTNPVFVRDREFISERLRSASPVRIFNRTY